MSNIQAYIKDSLSIKNVGPHILEKVNTLIQSAIWELKKNQLIPPKVVEFVSIDEKQERLNPNGSLKYNYYFLPKDFETLDEFFADDKVREPSRRFPYMYVAHENYIIDARVNPKRKLFTITDLTIDGNNRKVLIANPFPKDDTGIVLKYYENGTEDLTNRIGKNHWPSILREIEGELNLKRTDEVADARNIEISRAKNQKGINTPNQTSTKVQPKFFNGKSGRGSIFHKRNYR